MQMSAGTSHCGPALHSFSPTKLFHHMPRNTNPHAKNPSNPYASLVNKLDKLELIEILHGLLSPAALMGGVDGAFHQASQTLAVSQYILFEGEERAHPDDLQELNRFHYLHDHENFYFAGAEYSDVIALFDFEGFEDALEVLCLIALENIEEEQDRMPGDGLDDAQRLLQANTQHNARVAVDADGRRVFPAPEPLDAPPAADQHSGPAPHEDSSLRFNPFTTVRLYVPGDALDFPGHAAQVAYDYPKWRADLPDADIDRSAQAILRGDGIFVRYDAADYGWSLSGDGFWDAVEQGLAAGGAYEEPLPLPSMQMPSFQDVEPLITSPEVAACLVALKDIHAQGYSEPGDTHGQGH
ncbi:hypothetical protein [Pantoea sp. 18069]|uniref:hypothetical protein n=1 Tax=Pantoea sp. 18069 TaxID=2681415 RepID=UPI001359CDE6|nr:hypothetical protein [Pantoea sp. 18069]